MRPARENWLKLKPYSAGFAAAALERHESFQKRLQSTKQHGRMKRSWAMYYSRSHNGGGVDETELNASGERGEIVSLAPATYRRLIQDRVSLVQQTPPDPEPIALNTDPESQAQCSLVLGILDHYKREAHLEELGVERFEMASVLSESYMHVRWDGNLGDLAAAPAKEGDKPTYKGDLVFSVVSPYDVSYDLTSPDKRRPRWWVVEEPANRWDTLEQFGNEQGQDGERIRKAILDAEPYSKKWKELGYEHEDIEHDDSITRFWVYAERCASCPNGRRALVLDAKTVLLDGDLGEERAGVFPLYPSRVMMRTEGHTNNFGGMPVAQAFAAQISTITSNHATHGLTRLLRARKSNVAAVQYESGLGFVDYDHADDGGVPIPPPQVMRGVDSPPELFTMLDVLQRLQDTVQGGSPVTRGDPEATKGDSGSKAAMLYAAAQQVAAGDVRAKFRSDEEVFSFIISSLRIHATAERLITIAGKAHSQTARAFVGNDLDKIARVTVRQANPARDTFTGRMQLAELLMGIEDPVERERMNALIMTGKLEAVTQDIEAHRVMIDRENERLRDLTKPPPEVLKTDNHREHIAKHVAEMNDDESRENPQVRARFEEQIAWHVGCLTPTDARFAGFEVLMATGQEPLMPPMMAPPGGPAGPSNDNGKQPPKGASNDNAIPKPGDDLPRGPQMPKNPASGQRIEAGPGPGAPQAAGPA